MYVAGAPHEPPPFPSRYQTKRVGLVSGARGLKNVKPRKRVLRVQQHLPSPPRPHPENPKQDPPLTPREQFAEFYGFTLPPPLPQQEDPDAGYPYECGGGLITTDNLCSGPPPPAQFRISSSARTLSSILTHPGHPSPLNHDDLLDIFNGQLVHSKSSTRTPLAGTQQKRERSILPPEVEGKLLVPDVKLKVRCQHFSSSSIKSAPSTSPSRKLVESRIQDSYKQGALTLLTLRQPSFKTRPWSYDGVQTYPVLKLPPKKQTRILTKIVDGEEKEVETEVEVHEKLKKLFLFAPKVVPVH